MDLYKKQLELQRDSVVELKERFEKTLKIQEELLDKDDENLRKKTKIYKESLEDLQIAKLVKKLNKKIIKYKKGHFKEPFKKLIKKYQRDFNEMFDFKNKNIENFITTPLSISLINFIEKTNDYKQELKELKKENINFENLKQKNLKEIIKHSLHIYKDDFKDLFLSLKEADQFTSALIFLISSVELSYILINFILQIQQYENEKSDEFYALNRQNRGDELFGIIKRYFKKQDFNIDFIDDKKEQLIAQTLIDLLIELKYLQEVKKEDDEKDYIYLNTTKEFEEQIKSLREKLVNVRVRYKPMVVPPRDWVDVNDGGFLKDDDSSSEFYLLFIKHNIHNRLEQKEILKQKGKLPKEILHAINTIQKVPYKINKDMFDVIQNLNSKLKFNKFGKIKKEYYDKIEYYKEYIQINNINSQTALKEKLTNYYEDIKLKITDKEKKEKFDVEKAVKKALKYAKIVLENKNNKDFWINFTIELKLVKLQNSLNLLLELADEFKNYEKIYFVWQIDFRGRIYPVQTLLNPQGGDVAKSLLLFDKEQKLNERGIFWFKVHGANLYGEVDKEIFEKRIEWIDKNTQAIIDSANDPLKENFWKEADEPFEFLAFCFEYKRFIEDIDNFTTSLPVAIDGSNNGLQHISTLLRDIESAKKVNVLPTNKVEDIYKFIAQTLKEELEWELSKFEKEKDSLIKKGNLYFKEEEELVLDERAYAKELIEKIENLDISDMKNKKFSTALKLKKEKEYLDSIEKEVREDWEDLEDIRDEILEKLQNDDKKLKKLIKKGKLTNDGKKIETKLAVDVRSLIELLLQEKEINRKFVKKPVMTDSYGSTTRGKAEKIFDEIEFLKNKIEFEDIKEVYSVLRSFSNYLAKLIEESIAKNSQASVNYEEFIKKVAKKILETNNHIHWITPLGFRVQQLEYESKGESIYIKGKRKIKISIFEDKTDKEEHKRGILPNFIHSLDATHLYMTINSAKKQGVDYFMTVHDSFATLPNDMDILANTLREEFIKLYSKPVLEDLVEYIKNEFKIKTQKKTLQVPYVDKENFNLEDIKNSKYFFA